MDGVLKSDHDIQFRIGWGHDHEGAIAGNVLIAQKSKPVLKRGRHVILVRVGLATQCVRVGVRSIDYIPFKIGPRFSKNA